MAFGFEEYIKGYKKIANVLTVWVAPETPEDVRSEIAVLLERVTTKSDSETKLVIVDQPTEEEQLSFRFMAKVQQKPLL